MDQTTVTPVAGAPAAGWYADPEGHQRWWDGAAWTQHVLDTTPQPGQPVQPAQAVPAPAEAAVTAPLTVATTTLLPTPAGGEERAAPRRRGLSLPSISLPDLPRWVPVAAVAVVVALVAGYFFLMRGGDDPVPPTPAGGSVSAAVPTKAQLTAALPVAAALPKVGGVAWVADKAPSASGAFGFGAAAVIKPASCAPAAKAVNHVPGPPAAVVSRAYTLPKTGAVVSTMTRSFTAAVPVSAVSAAMTMATTCRTFTASAAPRTTFHVLSAKPIKAGLGGVHLRLSVGPAPTQVMDIALVRTAHAIIAVEGVGSGAASVVDSVAVRTAGHLPH